MKSIKWFIPFIFIGLTFQNCGSDGVVTEGNGQPYEGLSIEEPVPSEPGDIVDLEPEDFDQANFKTQFHCTSSSSEHLHDVRFGRLEDGALSMVIQKKDSSGWLAPWNIFAAWFPIFRPVDSDVTLKGLGLYKKWGERMKIIARYQREDGSMSSELFGCESPSGSLRDRFKDRLEDFFPETNVGN